MTQQHTKAIAYGGWSMPYFDPDAMGSVIDEVMATTEAQLIEHDLVDEYRLMIEPVLLGGGKRVFPNDGHARPLELVSTTTTGTSVLVCTYRPGGR